jgi:hypothetical protein
VFGGRATSAGASSPAAIETMNEKDMHAFISTYFEVRDQGNRAPAPGDQVSESALPNESLSWDETFPLVPGRQITSRLHAHKGPRSLDTSTM